MKNNLLKFIPYFVALIGAILIYSWVHRDIGNKITQRLPGADGRPIAKIDAEPNEIKGTLIKCTGKEANLPGNWPRFRGPDSTAIIKQDIQLAQQWPSEGPRKLWSIDVGEGYAGAAILNGRVYLLDYDAAAKADVIRCLSLADGCDIWKYSYPVYVKRNHGMSRTIPAVTEKFVVTLGPKCHVTCLDSTIGEFKWMIDLVKDYNTTIPQWYAGQCPIIDGKNAIIAPAGTALIIAVDCETGKVVWKTPNPNAWLMTHSSIIPAQLLGRKMYIYCGSGGVAGISTDDGSILWQTTEWKVSVATVPSPLPIGNDRVFLSGGYNAGSMMLALTQQDGKIIPKVLFKLSADTFGSPQQTPLFYNGNIYGVRPDGQMTCLDTDGKIIWTSRNDRRFGMGPYMIINDLMYIMDNSGTLTLLRPSPDGFNKLASAKVLDGVDSWGPMAVAGTRLIVRDLTKMVCLDTGK